MKNYQVLSVCGSGTVTSSMVAEKLKETLEEKGYIITTTEANPNEALALAQTGKYDFITFTSPLPAGDYGIPVISAIGFLTGFGEEEFLEEIDDVLDNLSK